LSRDGLRGGAWVSLKTKTSSGFRPTMLRRSPSSSGIHKSGELTMISLRRNFNIGDRVHVCDDTRRGLESRLASARARVWTIVSDDTNRTGLDSDGETIRRMIVDPEPAYRLSATKGAGFTSTDIRYAY